MFQDGENHKWSIFAFSKVFFKAFILFGFHNVCGEKNPNNFFLFLMRAV